MSGRELVLLADDEPLSREYLEEALQSLGVEVDAVADGDAAVAALPRRPYDYVFTDLKMPGRDGVAVLVESKLLEPDRPVILVTAHGTMGVAVEAMRKGADDILEKPVSIEDLELALVRVRDRRRLLRENRYLRRQTTGSDLLVTGPAMRAVVELLERVAPSKATVLIRGESGTGKECAAALIHRRSDRADGPFVKINCAAIPESLMESEFFGHEAGAFTGANKRREGRFELADGGTLFLDEVSEMAPALQAKLLRVLQEGEFERVGEDRTRKTDTRVIAATNRDLKRAAEAGEFREDLYYRLNVFPVDVPPLRARPEDIPPLAAHFVTHAARKLKVPEPRLTRAVVVKLQSYDWPGNVRELQNVIERGLIASRGRTLRIDLPAGEHAAPVVQPDAGSDEPVLTESELRRREADNLRRALARTRGKVYGPDGAAELLGLRPTTLVSRLKKLSIDRRSAGRGSQVKER